MGSKQAVVLVAGVGLGLTMLVSPPAYAQSVRNACAVVTQEQVTSAAGAAVGAGQPIAATGCSWSTDPKASAGRMMITLSIWGEKWFTKSSLPGVQRKDVGGIGDDAYFATLGDMTSLFVKKGKSTLQVRVYGIHDVAKQEAIERSIAKDALARW